MSEDTPTPAVAFKDAVSPADSQLEEIKPTIRTVTAFVHLIPKDFDVSWGSLFTAETAESKINKAVELLRAMESDLKEKGYEVQTLRIATNPFGEWMILSEDDRVVRKPSSTSDLYLYGERAKRRKLKLNKFIRLERLDQLLDQHKIDFCSVGPATNAAEARMCVGIVSQSHRFSCSKIVEAGDVNAASIAANTILEIAELGNRARSTIRGFAPSGSTGTLSNVQSTGNLATLLERVGGEAPKHIRDGLGNFRFCAASYCKPGIPFFPASKGPSIDKKATPSSEAPTASPLHFAIGLENGPVAQKLLKECQSVSKIRSEFGPAFAKILQPIQAMAESVAKEMGATYLGMDTSFNPSLDPANGSIASALEQLQEVRVFGGPGTLGAAAEITKALQSLEGIKLTGYCGLMLPVCEDTRLAELAGATDQRQLRVTDLLSISSVCGVGVDTVPIPGNTSKAALTSLILDVAGIAGRWNKSLSCRVFPVPGKTAGELTTFDSPFMVNSKIFSLE